MLGPKHRQARSPKLGAPDVPPAAATFWPQTIPNTSGEFSASCLCSQASVHQECGAPPGATSPTPARLPRSSLPRVLPTG